MARPISETTTFILSLPTTLPAKEVLAKAKARGIKTSENNVHRVRRIHGRSKQAIAKALTGVAARPAPTTLLSRQRKATLSAASR